VATLEERARDRPNAAEKRRNPMSEGKNRQWKFNARFEEGGVVVQMRKSAGQAAAKDAQKNPAEE
jgi:hypothetical protein